MTTISSTVGGARVERAAGARNAPIDRARSFLTLVVLLHHTVIPYTYFGHTDAKSWAGLDMIVLATDSFFMAMFFFLSGLFVWPSLSRKTLSEYLNDRMLRLGLPFVISAFTIIPIAYYAIELRQHPGIGFSQFWWHTITKGPWPGGPVWFIWVLLAFNLIAMLLYQVAPRALEPVNRLSVQAFERPAKFFLFMLAVTIIAYVPCRVYFGPGRWFTLGPFDLQATRVLLYPAYFFIGAAVGAANVDRGLLGAQGRLADTSGRWALVALVPYGLMWLLIYVKREILGNPVWLPDWYEGSYGLCFAAFSAAMMFAILGFFLGSTRRWMLLDRMRGDAYGIFLVHYPIVLWLQYWLFDFDLPAVVKSLTVFVGAVALSWAATAVLRKLPGAARVL